jgi:lipopolysaccharide/colanic/teichoic acid biosynthesis glycosyltransferase
MVYEIVKRLVDIAVSAAALILLFPMLIVVAAAIRLESPGSPLFVQQRVGRHGRLFPMVKFRSMVKDAPQLGGYQTQKGDPRITRMGKFIRTTSLDELPQLWNVLTGDMSLIGPRPETPAQQALYRSEDWAFRHRVRPGITGLAQVNGRSNLPPEGRLRLDLVYAAGPTLSGDIMIILKTLWQALHKVGVN